MKRRPLFLVLCALVCSPLIGAFAADKAPSPAPAKPSASVPNFAGSWIFQTENGGFGVDLGQTGDKVEGFHNSVVNGGRRVDTVLKEDGSPPSITGTIVNGVATVTFKSGYGDGTGTAVMRIVKGELDWTIQESTGQHYLPDECMMTREKPKKGGAKKK